MPKRKVIKRKKFHFLLPIAFFILVVGSWFTYSKLVVSPDINKIASTESGFGTQSTTDRNGCVYKQVQCIQAPCEPMLVSCPPNVTPAPSCVPNPCPKGALCKLKELPVGQIYCDVPNKADDPEIACTQIAGSCLSTAGTCVTFTDGCMQGKLCANPYQACNGAKPPIVKDPDCALRDCRMDAKRPADWCAGGTIVSSRDKCGCDTTQCIPGPIAIPTNCAKWFDGCNTCGVKDGSIYGCTKMACMDSTKAPGCLSYIDQIPTSTPTPSGCYQVATVCPEGKMCAQVMKTVCPSVSPSSAPNPPTCDPKGCIMVKRTADWCKDGAIISSRDQCGCDTTKCAPIPMPSAIVRGCHPQITSISMKNRCSDIGFSSASYKCSNGMSAAIPEGNCLSAMEIYNKVSNICGTICVD